jgi:hypothetical protein
VNWRTQFGQALFSSQLFFWFLASVVLSFVFGNYYPTIDQLGSKDLSRKLQPNYIISYFFYLYLILHTCI